MYGAIIGDLAGSIYEYGQIKNISEVTINKLIEDNSFFSDDSILTIAILDAILNNGDYSSYIRKYINKYSEYKPNFSPYFKSPFSPGMMKWAKGSGTANSCGNGAMMRISPVGYMFDTESEVISNAYLATIPTHDSYEAINSARVIALMIFYFRNGLSKDEVYNKLNLDISYKPFTKFNTTCSETLCNCLYAIYNSDSFYDSIRKVISMGGDTDTNACIVGSVSEAIYGIDDELKELVYEKLDDDLGKVLRKVK